MTRIDPDSEMFGEKDTNDQGVAFAGLEPGTMQFLDPGEDVKFTSPADVGGTYEAFIKQTESNSCWLRHNLCTAYGRSFWSELLFNQSRLVGI